MILCMQSTGALTSVCMQRANTADTRSMLSWMNDLLQSSVLENFLCLNLQIMQYEKHFFLRSTIQHFNFICACEEADKCPERQMFPALLLQHAMLLTTVIPPLQTTHRLDSLSLTSISLHYPLSCLEPLPRRLWTRTSTRTPFIASSHA
jgi:hypothetical protein